MQALTNATTATTNSTIELILRQFTRWSCRCLNVVPSNWFHAALEFSVLNTVMCLTGIVGAHPPEFEGTD
jgi:hypothetical protein